MGGCLAASYRLLSIGRVACQANECKIDTYASVGVRVCVCVMYVMHVTLALNNSSQQLIQVATLQEMH